MKFKLIKSDLLSSARAGKLITQHGEVHTPVFMPVGTLGTVKGVHHRELVSDIGNEIILCNTYHLYLRPGLEVIEQAGGIHGFARWNKPVLTDSGGYQVYSLASKRKIEENGVRFSSHIDGSVHCFTPEFVIDAQRIIGSDIIMPLDECTPYPCERAYALASMRQTHRWLKRSVKRMHACSMDVHVDSEQALFGIVQGGVFGDLRKESAELVNACDLPGTAIGGLSVGEPSEEMYEMTALVCETLPENKPRYLMGVGTPANLLECIALGVDMFDCVIPTRNGRNGWIYTARGIINIRNEKWKNDYSAIDDDGITFVDSQYSKAYLRHLIISGEMLGAQIASIHNLGFYKWLTATARERILNGTFADWKNGMISSLEEKI